jgi:hypothetical protein
MWARIRRLFSSDAGPAPELASRHERREAARERHHETDEPMWTEADRHVGGPGKRDVQDVTPGLLGADPSRRTIDGD